MKQHKRNIALTLLLLVAAVAFAFKSHLLAPDVGEALAAPEGIDVRAAPVPLNSEDPAIKRVGALRYRAGWVLTSSHKRFGGLSGLSLSQDGRLVAISDQGDWFLADFRPGGDRVIQGGSLVPFEPAMPDDSKEAFDAESLIPLEDDFLVAFEQEHRLVRASPGMPGEAWAPGTRMDFSGIADNSGMEAITWTRDGKLLAFSERGKDVRGRLKGWLVDADRVDAVYFSPPGSFAPTDAALLPNGDILLLVRFFSLADGVAVKLLRISADSIQPGATLIGEELAHLAPPFTVDNMEGLDVGLTEDGSTLVYMLSDDNFKASQRTLLLMFALEE